MDNIVISIDNSEHEGMRVDKFISDILKLFTRSQIKNRDLQVIINDKKVKLSRRISLNDELEIKYSNPAPVSFSAEKIDLDIVYEDKSVIVINKPQGMVVHPAIGNYTGTLVQGLLYHCENLKKSFDSDEIRPGIVHRLDKDTSGIIIAAKDPETKEFLSRQFRLKKTEKIYHAIIKGRIKKGIGVIENYLIRDPSNRKRFTWSENSGKYSITEYRVLKRWEDYTLVKLIPKTGRTHQLRVHMLSMGHPILGDPVYGRSDKRNRDVTMMLHAVSLGIFLPGEDEKRVFSIEEPERFLRLKKEL